MSLPLPLAVGIKTSRGFFDVTPSVDDLSCRWAVPGGMASAQLILHRPLTAPINEIEHFAKVYVVDTRLGETMWDGWLEDPGRATDRRIGEGYRLTAMGPAARAHDITAPYVYVDKDLTHWMPGKGSATYFRFEEDVQQRSVERLKCDQGATWGVGGAAGIAYRLPAGSGQDLGRVSADWDTGETTANATTDLRVAVDETGLVTVTGAAWNTAGGTLTGTKGGSPVIPSGNNWAYLRVIRVTAAGTGAETTWAELTNIVVIGSLKSKSGGGAGVPSTYADNTLLASEIVADVVGRLLIGVFDGANARIDTTSFTIDHLVYLDGADAWQIFDDLAVLEPGFYWAAWESAWSGSKNRFEYVAWPTKIRYLAPNVDSLDLPSSGVSLFNAVTVRYKDSAGVQTLTSTQVLPELDNAVPPLTRQGFVDLGDQLGSAANAGQAASSFLAEHKTPQAGGTITISRPIRDLTLGRMVYPWEIRPGQLIAAEELNTSVASFYATDRDGQAVFRLKSVEFNARSGSSVCEVDAYTPSNRRAVGGIWTGPLIRPVSRPVPR